MFPFNLTVDSARLRPASVTTGLPVLVVDDDPLTASGFSALLKMGVGIAISGSATAGFDVFQRGRFSVVLLNNRLRRIDGDDLIERIARHDASVPVILTSDRPTIDGAVGVLRKGAFDYLPKPFDTPQLHQVVGNARRWHALKRRSAFQRSRGRTLTISIILSMLFAVIAMHLP